MANDSDTIKLTIKVMCEGISMSTTVLVNRNYAVDKMQEILAVVCDDPVVNEDR